MERTVESAKAEMLLSVKQTECLMHKLILGSFFALHSVALFYVVCVFVFSQLCQFIV